MARSTYVYIVLKRCNILTARNLTPEEIDNVRKTIDSLDAIIQQEVVASFTVKYEMINWLKKQKSTKKFSIIRTAGNTDVKNVTKTILEELAKELGSCPNCKEPMNTECACFRNRCIKCNGPVGNITFTYCYNCWDKK